MGEAVAVVGDASEEGDFMVVAGEDLGWGEDGEVVAGGVGAEEIVDLLDVFGGHPGVGVQDCQKYLGWVDIFL